MPRSKETERFLASEAAAIAAGHAKVVLESFPHDPGHVYRKVIHETTCPCLCCEHWREGHPEHPKAEPGTEYLKLFAEE